METENLATLLIMTADKPRWSLALWTNAAAFATGMPFIRGNQLGVGPFVIPGKTSCLNCEKIAVDRDIPDAQEMIDGERAIPSFASPSISVAPCVTASLLALEAIHYICGLESEIRTLGKRIKWSARPEWTFKTEVVIKQSSCPICGQLRIYCGSVDP